MLAEAGELAMHQSYTLLRRYAHAHNQRLSELARALASGRHGPGDSLTQHSGAS